MAFANTGWKVILDYLERRQPDEMGIDGAYVTHAWTQDMRVTEKLCKACHIPNALMKLDQMISHVDAVIIARDDHEQHFELARPFLEANKVVFIDKPLSINDKELDFFTPYLIRGQCMTTSGLRYAQELDKLKTELPTLGKLCLVQAVVVNDLLKYGIHMLDVVASLQVGDIKTMTRLPAPFQAFSFHLEGDVIFNLACLGPVSKTFSLGVYGTKGSCNIQLLDNFSAFKRLLTRFVAMVKDQKPPFNPDQVIQNMKILSVGESLPVGCTVDI